MPDQPILLALVHTPTLHEALANNASEFDVRWSFEATGYTRTDESGRREIAGIAELRPSLIVIELDQPADWLPKVHGDPATRRIPIIAIADGAEAMERAVSAKANVT